MSLPGVPTAYMASFFSLQLHSRVSAISHIPPPQSDYFRNREMEVLSGITVSHEWLRQKQEQLTERLVMSRAPFRSLGAKHCHYPHFTGDRVRYREAKAQWLTARKRPGQGSHPGSLAAEPCPSCLQAVLFPQRRHWDSGLPAPRPAPPTAPRGPHITTQRLWARLSLGSPHSFNPRALQRGPQPWGPTRELRSEVMREAPHSPGNPFPRPEPQPPLKY